MRRGVVLCLSAWMRVQISLVTAKVRKAVKDAKHHIWRGCLNISGRGTQNNEELHRLLGKSLSRGRQGVAPVHALFNINFHKFHLRLWEKDGQHMLHRTLDHAHAGWTPPKNGTHFEASTL